MDVSPLKTENNVEELFTLYTGPKPPCPSLFETEKLSVAALIALRSIIRGNSSELTLLPSVNVDPLDFLSSCKKARWFFSSSANDKTVLCNLHVRICQFSVASQSVKWLTCFFSPYSPKVDDTRCSEKYKNNCWYKSTKDSLQNRPFLPYRKIIHEKKIDLRLVKKILYNLFVIC